jgi:hypothetical protein
MKYHITNTNNIIDFPKKQKIPLLERFAAQSLVEYEGELIFSKEKFAELIVQECMQQVEEQYKPVLEDETMMKDTHWDGYVQCGVDSYVAIREHFFGEEE